MIKSPMGKNIIIDGGNNQDYDYGENVVVPYLLDRKITKIDFLMVSHFDSDHAGGCAKVLETLDVANIILAEQIEKSDIYTEILSIAKKKNIKLIYVKAGDEINIDGMKLKILHPQKEQILENAMNNNSVVFRLEYKDFSMLFTGDIEKIAEEEIVDTYNNTNILDVDVLKVAHHGSKSSSIEEIIERVTPKVSIIGVGADNKYGHPNKDVLARLQNYGSRVFRTDENGEISIIVNRKGKIVKVEKYLK